MSLCLEENSFFYLLLLSRMYIGVCSDSVKTRDFSVTVTNDANAAAIGEMTNLDSFVMEIFIE